MVFLTTTASCMRLWFTCGVVMMSILRVHCAEALLIRSGGVAAPVYSRDGTIVVHAPLTKAQYRMPVLSFVSQWRDDLQSMLKLTFGAHACPLEIVIGGRSDGDTRVLSARLREPEGGIRERIELPDPETADLMLLRRAVFIALLRAWMVNAGGRDGEMQDIPIWLIDGMLRHLLHQTRQADVDRTLLLWSRACLPPAMVLFGAESLAGLHEPAVAAVLASWFLEKRRNTFPLEALLKSAAYGTVWSSETAGKLLTDTSDALVFDAYVDGRMLKAGRLVLEPGLTSEGIMRRFRAHLLLYPSYYGNFLAENRSWCSFHEAITLVTDQVVRVSAEVQAKRIKIAAVGRDGMLRAVADSYVGFLEALATGASQSELPRLLMEAERMRGVLEQQTVRGGVSQPVIKQ